MDRRGALRAAAIAAAGVVSVTACDTSDAGRKSGARAAGATAPAASHTTAAPSSLAALPPEIVSGPRDSANVALTFHGQGDANQIRALLDELARGGARATVLAVGSWLEAEPSMAKRILDDGHEL